MDLLIRLYSSAGVPTQHSTLLTPLGGHIYEQLHEPSVASARLSVPHEQFYNDPHVHPLFHIHRWHCKGIRWCENPNDFVVPASRSSWLAIVLWIFCHVVLKLLQSMHASIGFVLLNWKGFLAISSRHSAIVRYSKWFSWKSGSCSV